MRLIMLPGDSLIIGHVDTKEQAQRVLQEASRIGTVHGAWLWGRSPWVNVNVHHARRPYGAEMLAMTDLPIIAAADHRTVHVVCRDHLPVGVFSNERRAARCAERLGPLCTMTALELDRQPSSIRGPRIDLRSKK